MNTEEKLDYIRGKVDTHIDEFVNHDRHRRTADLLENILERLDKIEEEVFIQGPFKIGDKSKAICKNCSGLVPTTFKAGKEEIIYAHCDICDCICSTSWQGFTSNLPKEEEKEEKEEYTLLEAIEFMTQGFIVIHERDEICLKLEKNKFWISNLNDVSTWLEVNLSHGQKEDGYTKGIKL